MRMIRELILNLEEEANELDSVGNYKRAERNRIQLVNIDRWNIMDT